MAAVKLLPNTEMHRQDHQELCSEKHALDQEPTKGLRYHLITAFLFTKSDFKTIIFPQSIFAIAGALSSVHLTMNGAQLTLPEMAYRVPCMILWLWVNLLVEDLANQRLSGSIIEDETNKPWRPIPSKRLTPEEAKSWLFAAIAAAMALSVLLGAFTPCVTLMTLVWLYNDLEGSCTNWVRNLLNAGGLMCFGWGALQIITAQELRLEGYMWLWTTGAVVMTTVHAQDFPDLEGDIARGRTTIPIEFGDGFARGSLMVMVLFWSLVCPMMWHTSLVVQMVVLGIGGGISIITGMRWGQAWDEVAWKSWCLWIAALYVLPAFSNR
ncbi:hypothetical protein ACJ41O_008993 [Fusarium nematophilum]